MEKTDFKIVNGDYDIINNDNCKYLPQKKTSYNKRSASMTEIIQPYVSNLVDKNSAKNKKMLNLVSEMDDHYKNGNFKINQKDNTPNDSDLKRNIRPALNGRASSAINQSKMEKVYEQTSSLFNKEFYDTNLNSKNFIYLFLFYLIFS